MLQHDYSDHPDVMVSSTYINLIAHREAACEALLRLGFFPIGMEYDSAKAGKDVIASSLDMVAGAHAYIGIIGHRYGGVPQDTSKNPDALSITELEYREALKRGIPVFMFLMSDDHDVKLQDVEPVEAYQAKLQALKADAKLRSICATFSSVDELHSRVLQSMLEFKVQLASEAKPRRKPSQRRKAWVEPRPPQLLAIPDFISGHEFVGRREELAWLNQWATESDSLLVIEAIGGSGKSTLAWQWLNQQATTARPEFAGRLWYSFYEGGADMASFAAHAFTYVTGQPLSRYLGRKTAELARLLIAALRERPFLLVLDGLERVLVAYHRLDASQARDDEVASGRDDRACIKPADSDFLRQLVVASPSKILITTRLLPTALLNKSGQVLPGARHRVLGGLHSDDALTLIRSVGVKGDAKAIQHYLTENFDNHPQIVGVVAGLVKDYVWEPGNFDRWAADPQAGAALHLSQLNLVQRQTHILSAALNGLMPGVRQVLSRIAALGAAIGFETVQALNPFLPPPLPASSKPFQTRLLSLTSELKRLGNQLQSAPGSQRAWLTSEINSVRARIAGIEAEHSVELQAIEEYRNSEDVREALPRLVSALRKLEQRGLLQWDRQKNTYDLHPVVRGYAFDVLDQAERVDICGRIADHFRSRPGDRYSETKTLADVQQSMDIFRSLVHAGRFAQAVMFYHGNFANALCYSIEAYHEILALLKPLFPNGFARRPVEFTDPIQSYLLNNAAVALIMLGRLQEARETLTVKLRLDLDDRNRENVRLSLANLGETVRDENKLHLSLALFELAFELAAASKSYTSMARCQWHLMVTYRITGQFKQAEAAYKAFRSLPTPESRAIYRAGDVEGELCSLRFYQDMASHIKSPTNAKYWQSVKDAAQNLIPILSSPLTPRGILTVEQLDEAEEIAHAGNNRLTLRSLLCLRGELALERGDATSAITYFERAIEMAQAVGLVASGSEARLALANAHAGKREAAHDMCERLHELVKVPHVELAPAFLELGDRDRAHEHALAGYAEAWADGPPYSRWWELEQCRMVLKSLGKPEPQLSKFDPQAIEPIPYESVIRQLIADLRKGRR